jgi:hypothetical protein
MHAEDGSHLSLVMTGFHESVNLVSLLAGKLVVAQWVLLLTWRLKQHRCYLSLLFNRQLQSCTYKLNPRKDDSPFSDNLHVQASDIFVATQDFG